jgi:hypothetical protein
MAFQHNGQEMGGNFQMNCIGELANLTTKIITLLEFFNFVSEVSRLKYE